MSSGARRHRRMNETILGRHARKLPCPRCGSTDTKRVPCSTEGFNPENLARHDAIKQQRTHVHMRCVCGHVEVRFT